MSHAIYEADDPHPIIVQPATMKWRPDKRETPWVVVDTITDRVVDRYTPTKHKNRGH